MHHGTMASLSCTKLRSTLRMGKSLSPHHSCRKSYAELGITQLILLSLMNGTIDYPNAANVAAACCGFVVGGAWCVVDILVTVGVE